jgi:hypothetical protein
MGWSAIEFLWTAWQIGKPYLCSNPTNTKTEPKNYINSWDWSRLVCTINGSSEHTSFLHSFCHKFNLWKMVGESMPFFSTIDNGPLCRRVAVHNAPALCCWQWSCRYVPCVLRAVDLLLSLHTVRPRFCRQWCSLLLLLAYIQVQWLSTMMHTSTPVVVVVNNSLIRFDTIVGVVGSFFSVNVGTVSTVDPTSGATINQQWYRCTKTLCGSAGEIPVRVQPGNLYGPWYWFLSRTVGIQYSGIGQNNLGAGRSVVMSSTLD